MSKSKQDTLLTAERRRDLAAQRLYDYIRTTVDAAPPLTPAQVARLAVLFRPADRTPDDREAAQT